MKGLGVLALLRLKRYPARGFAQAIAGDGIEIIDTQKPLALDELEQIADGRRVQRLAATVYVFWRATGATS